MNHSFDIDIAQEVGVEAAIIYENVRYWIAKNVANQENARDGYTWVYNSRSAWCELLPYLGEKQIRNAIERLLEAGYLARAQYSYGPMNRTYWYRLGERAKQVGPNGQTKVGPNGQTKTDINTDINGTIPYESPKRQTAKRERPAATSLEEFLQNSGGEPPTTFGDYANNLGWSPEFSGRVWERFSRYWRSPDAKGGGRKRDWLSTWQNWCDREAENGRRGGGSGGVTGGGLAAALRASVDSRQRRMGADGGVNAREGASASGSDTGRTLGRDGEPEIPF